MTSSWAIGGVLVVASWWWCHTGDGRVDDSGLSEIRLSGWMGFEVSLGGGLNTRFGDATTRLSIRLADNYRYVNKSSRDGYIFCFV
jgi:hypothetical protein